MCAFNYLSFLFFGTCGGILQAALAATARCFSSFLA